MDLEYNKLDDDWIDKFEKTDNLFKDFYKEDIYYITLRTIYINRENEIDKLKQESFLMTNPNKITQEEILGILKNNAIDNEKRYTLLSILTYNITLEPDEVSNYLSNNDNHDKYLSINKNIDTIRFEKSINMFHDLNDIILIFYEKSSEIKKKNANNMTKKIFLRSLNSNRKTIKKRFKE